MNEATSMVLKARSPRKQWPARRWRMAHARSRLSLAELTRIQCEMREREIQRIVAFLMEKRGA